MGHSNFRALREELVTVMVEDSGYREGRPQECEQQEGTTGKDSRACKDLSEQQLESIYGEEDPHKQFE